MHELALTRSIIEACNERAGGSRVLRVTVEVGMLSCVMPEALRFCFTACRAHTALADAELEIVAVPGQARCCGCGREVILHDWLATCACGSTNLTDHRGGEGLCIRSMEVEDVAPAGVPAAPRATGINGE